MEEPTVQFSDEDLVDNFPAMDDERIQLEDLEFEVERPPEGLEDDGGGNRGELRICRQRMDLLAKQQESLAAEIATEKEANNMAAIGRLQAASRRLQTELENEKDLQSKITAMLKDSDPFTPVSPIRNAMWHIEIQKGQFEDVRKHHEEEAKARQRSLEVHSAQQLQKEKEAMEKSERNRLLRARKSLHTQKELGLKHQKLVEDAQRNHKIAVKFLKASLGRVREKEQKEEVESRKHMQRRMDAVLALKNNITASRETLKKFQAWGQNRAEQAKQKALTEKEVILAQGGDAFKYLFHQRRHQELEAQKRAFEEEQKLRKQEIVSKILKEEAEEEQRKRRQHLPPKSRDRWTLRDKTWKYISDFCEGKTALASTHQQDSDLILHPKPLSVLKAISSESVQVDLGSISTEDEVLAEPDIPGLWSKESYQSHQVPKEDMERKPVGGSKMEKDILARTMEQLRRGVVQKQVVSGREFKGRPFNSKPKVIHFKDFDIGKVYKKKITLINATYTINYCKLVGVEENLKDFIHIDFDPPGPMSAGMSCEVLVTFKPMINKDLEGNVSFLAQTGGFSVPLKCSTKKCSLSLDKELIEFGSYVVGETTTRIITLTNVGGLGTKFKFLLDSEFYEMDESQPGVKISSLFTCEDKSLYEKIMNSLSEQQLEINESPPVDLLSQKESEKQLDETEVTTAAVSAMTVIPSEEQAEITLGEVTEGEIGPFSSIKVPITFTPVIPGEVHTKFKVMFKNPQSPTRATGTGIDVPVWVPKATVDLKICMYDRLYQDSITVHTRSKAALRLKFEVCKELRGHIELLPETGYIQAQSTYSVQLKFLPRQSLPEDAKKYFDPASRVLEAPMTIRVADQNKPVRFTVQAIVTTSDLEINPSEINFGYCTIYEAIRTEIRLSNLSLLPQEFGFVGLPKYVDIQPNDGFGTILPLETLQLDLIFQPIKAKEYKFELVCKSEINRCFKVSCQAVGVHPPLELSHYQIKFSATSLYDTSVSTLYVINSHMSMNKLIHSLPRIGSEEATPVGPTSFEFLLPPNSPITISPCVGTVLPGKRCLVQVAFQPVLPQEVIFEEAAQILNKEMETKTIPEGNSAKERTLETVLVRGPGSQPGATDQGLHSPSCRVAAEASDQCQSSTEFQAAQASLSKAFQGKFDRFVIPCVVASGDIKDRKTTEPLNFSPHNTLYLELWCPSVAPFIVVTSHKGKTVFNFGDIAVGHRSIKKITLQNICNEDLTLEYSVLNPNGPFVRLNPFNKLRSGETQTLVLSFSPHENILAQETLDIITKRGTLSLTLLGMGVASMITCSIDGNILNMGYVLARESVSTNFKLQNESSLPIKFWVRLESLSKKKAEAYQQLPKFLTSHEQRTEIVGTQNYNGQSVFSIVPVEGLMFPGKAQEFTVTFSPDHESLYFSDLLQVVLFEKKVSHQILLKGAAREHMMFVEGGDPLDVPVESLAVITAFDPEHKEAEEIKPILVTLNYVQFDTDTTTSPATRELQVGCIRTTQPSPRKTVEFSLDGVSWLQHKGFSIEPSRGSVERGQTKTINISWVPPADFDPDHPLMVSTLLQLRGDVKETYKVIFVAHVVTEL
ncbi:Cilia- and flagella-associated protein 74 [Apodemus speciosus]|uniref:Cilia- and flagella-associated protein 74 n=1 Tax=Apodemus speciosus TaxID=105296 RepID=A0ABQ0EQM1_APOSI